MVTCSWQFSTLEDLRDYINNTLCQTEQFEVDAFPLTERMLVRSGRPCGMMYCLHGPRAVKLTAIWDAQANTILFYGAGGERIGRRQLVFGPPLEESAVA
jgi:hypothetical protein